MTVTTRSGRVDLARLPSLPSTVHREVPVPQHLVRRSAMMRPLSHPPRLQGRVAQSV